MVKVELLGSEKDTIIEFSFISDIDVCIVVALCNIR